MNQVGTIVSDTASEGRIVFLDNLRYLFVIGVVLQHSAMPYFGSDWWPVRDTTNMLAGTIAGIIAGTMDGFLMPSLFFIAGFFAVPTIDKHAISSFIKGKLKRLGIPWLICILFICPTLPLIYHFTHNGLTLSTTYWQTWLTVMGNALKFDVGLLPPMNQVMQQDLFYQRYMWFISLLTAFFLIFSLFYKFRKQWFEPMNFPSQKSVRPAVATCKIIFSIGVITLSGSILLIAILFLSTSSATDPETWLTLGNFIQFRVGRIFMHVSYFIFGILVYKRQWVQRGLLPGHMAIWGISFGITFIGYFASFGWMQLGPDQYKLLSSLVNRIFLNFFTISALGLTGGLAYTFFQRPTIVNRKLAMNSYYLYIAHYPFVFIFQLILISFPVVPPVLKYLIVCIFSVICAYLTSEFVIRRYPKITIFGVFFLFLGMLLFIKPV